MSSIRHQPAVVVYARLTRHQLDVVVCESVLRQKSAVVVYASLTIYQLAVVVYACPIRHQPTVVVYATPVRHQLGDRSRLRIHHYNRIVSCRSPIHRHNRLISFGTHCIQQTLSRYTIIRIEQPKLVNPILIRAFGH